MTIQLRVPTGANSAYGSLVTREDGSQFWLFTFGVAIVAVRDVDGVMVRGANDTGIKIVQAEEL